jgi:hypothetical protein
MKYILVKEGEHRPSVFSDLVEVINHADVEQVGFFTKVDPGLRLIRNRSDTDTNLPFAVAHYHTEPTLKHQPSTHFRPLNTDIMISALEEYDYVIFGTVTPTHMVHDHTAIVSSRYIARKHDGKLIDVQTQEIINPDHSNVTFFTGFVGMVKCLGLPVYYMILNNNLIHATDGFDYYHTSSDTLWMLLSDYDGTLKNRLFTPVFDDTCKVIDSTILPSFDSFTLSFFDTDCSVLRRENLKEIMDNVTYNINTNLSYTLEGNVFTFTRTPGTVGYIEIEFKCGLFFDLANQVERPLFKYVIL